MSEEQKVLPTTPVPGGPDPQGGETAPIRRRTANPRPEALRWAAALELLGGAWEAWDRVRAAAATYPNEENAEGWNAAYLEDETRFTIEHANVWLELAIGSLTGTDGSEGTRPAEAVTHARAFVGYVTATRWANIMYDGVTGMPGDVRDLIIAAADSIGPDFAERLDAVIRRDVLQDGGAVEGRSTGAGDEPDPFRVWQEVGTYLTPFENAMGIAADLARLASPDPHSHPISVDSLDFIASLSRQWYDALEGLQSVIEKAVRAELRRGGAR